MCILIGSLFAGACSAAAAVGTAAAAAGGAALAAGSAVAGTAAAVGSATIAAGGAIAGTAAAAGGAALGAVGSAAGAIGSATLAAGSATIGAAGSLAGTTAGLVSGAASTIGGAATAGSFAVGTLGATSVTGAITGEVWRKIVIGALIAGGTGTALYVLKKKLEDAHTRGEIEGRSQQSEIDQQKFINQVTAWSKEKADMLKQNKNVKDERDAYRAIAVKLQNEKKALEDWIEQGYMLHGKGKSMINGLRSKGKDVSQKIIDNFESLDVFYNATREAIA